VAVILGTVLPQVLNAPTSTPSQQEILKELESLLIPFSFDNGTAIRTASSAQNKALIWLSNNTDLNLYSNATKIQRYSLATLFYSTNGTSWYEKDEWMSDFDECRWYNNGKSLCTRGYVDTLSLVSNNLFGTIPKELAMLSNLSKLSSVWLLVVMIVLSCVFHCTLMLACHIHSTDELHLNDNSLKGTIPTEIALMSNLCESSVVWLLVAMIVLCVCHCTLMLACHFTFYSCIVSQQQ
jgi:hypothetical protein